MEHETYDELTAAYALDALDDDELGTYEEHLAGCAICQDNLAAMAATGVHLAYAAAPADPPPALRERILEAARAERENVVPLRPRGGWAALRARPLLAAAAAVAACLVVGLGIWNVSLRGELDDAREAQALRSASLVGARGSVVVGAGNEGMLVVSDLDPAPAGKTYEAWVISDDVPAPAGTFKGGGTVAVRLAHPVPPGAIVAVTLEEGEVEQPTTKPLITSRPV